MNVKIFLSVASLVLLGSLISCQKNTGESPADANLIFKFKFDPSQQRLNNIGQAAPLPAGHAGQSPSFHHMSAHYLELAPSALTALGQGTILYRAAETPAGGSPAIDFEKSIFAANNEIFFQTPLRNISPGKYEWLRLSLAYQNYDVKFFVDTVINGISIQQEFDGTVASFIGFNTYITNFKIREKQVNVNGNRKQGYWGFETNVNFNGINFPFFTTGQAPEGSTTVVNPIFATSPVPPGSCVVTAGFDGAGLTITGTETQDIVVEVSLSTNKSFEWKEVIADGKWAPTKGEQVVDMGIRGMKIQVH